MTMTDAGNIGAGADGEANVTAPHTVASAQVSSVRLLGSPARVQCEKCEFCWYGATAAHGLSIIGHCPRCGGGLHFRDEPGGPSVVAAGPAALDLEPAQVLGTPKTWAR
jgi:NAD-dependent SIR2 family protein deacetylase